jgi:Met-zincin/Domain of unknown function (DUF5117)
MKRWSGILAFGLGLLLVLGPAVWQGRLPPGILWGQGDRAIAKPAPTKPQPAAKPTAKSPKPAKPAGRPNPTNAQEGSRPSAAQQGDPSGRETPGEPEGDRAIPLKPFAEVIANTTPYDGLLKLYHNPKTGRMFAEILPNQLNQRYLAAIALESGIGEQSLYRGMPLTDFMFTLRQVNNTIQLVVPNTYFRAQKGTPMQRSLDRSFSESVLAVMPIRSRHAERKSVLVDFTPILLGDLAGLVPALSETLGGGYALDPSKSYIGTTKAFPQNLEIESIYGFSGGEGEVPSFLSNLPDSRSFNLRLHYSLSQLPENRGYRPRLADDRIGYFVTAYKDFTSDKSRDGFVRYIERWNLQKQDPTALLSPPKQPIVFWLENTIPLDYRDAVRDGILMWNQAFEKIGFKDAIEVRQMPDRADWDPADVRYNTIRWFNATDALFAMGPKRSNPLTGEILDADILVDGDFIRAIKQDYRTIVEQTQSRTLPFLAQLTGNSQRCENEFESPRLWRELTKTPPPKSVKGLRLRANASSYQDLCWGSEALRQLSVGRMSLSLTQNALPNGEPMKEYIQEFIRELIAHEVGHTLGLRHNFRGSTMLLPEELNNREITRKRGLVGSVMDYNAVNLAPPGTPQGDYYTHLVGPYDEWAIAYGYAPSDATTPQGESTFLAKIAQRAPEPGLAYGTDEDTIARLDPAINRFDMSGDLLTYAPAQMANARAMWQRIEQRYPLQGDGFNDLRVAFDDVFFYYVRNAFVLTRYIGGQSFNRYRAGDVKGRLPFEPIPLQKQRQALAILQKDVFSESAFQFSPTLLNKLAPSRWNHWGTFPEIFQLDYPIHDRILLLQTFTMFNLFDYDRLARLRDAELRAPADQVLTIPELFETLQTSVWGEVMQPPEPALKLSGLRRGLQRQHMNILIAMLLRQVETPEDARTVARYELKQLYPAIERALRHVDDKDIYTKAHLEEAHDRIGKAIAANLQSE